MSMAALLVPPPKETTTGQLALGSSFMFLLCEYVMSLFPVGGGYYALPQEPYHLVYVFAGGFVLTFGG
jgi:hypothetical protein